METSASGETSLFQREKRAKARKRKKERKKASGVGLFLACRCVCAGKAGEPWALKAFIAGWPPLAVHCTLPPGVLCSRAHRQSAVLCPFLFSPCSALFSFPHHLPWQIPPSISRPGVEFQHCVENKRERNPNPTCNSMRRDRTQLCLMPISVSSGLCFGATG